MKRSLVAVLSLGLLLAACDQPASPSAVKNPVPEAYRDTTGAAWKYSGPASALPLGTSADSALFSTTVTASSSWGPIELNTSNGEKSAGDGHPITMNGVVYQSGLGLHAGAEISYSSTQPTGVSCELTAEVGIDDEVGSKGSVSFQVFADGAKLYDSGRLTGADGAAHLAATIPSAKSIRLVVTNGGDDYYYDHADIANPSISCAPTVTKTLYHLVYSDSFESFHTVYSDGSSNVRITPTSIDLRMPRYSPDGTRIIGSNGSIYIMNADGSNLKPVAPPTTDIKVEAGWSPDGSKIVYTQATPVCSTCVSAPKQIWTVSSDGSNAKEITYQNDNNHPVWSPDGSKILFDRFESPFFYHAVMNPDGSNITRVPLDYYASFIKWSADGKSFYYTRGRQDNTDNRDIYKVNVDGSGLTKINNFDAGVYNIALSHDGKKIAFTSNLGMDTSGLFIMNVDGTDVEAVPGTETANDLDFQP